jgi:DNA-binding transcriptional regulator YdaS (Cro superfamily)
MTMPALKSLASFLKEIDDPEFKAGEWSSPSKSTEGHIQMPYVISSPTVERFIEAAYEHKWVRPGLDWPTWAQSSQAARFRDDPDSIANAGELDLARLLTVCIRGDKFSEGALLEAFESGLIRRIVRRAASILAEITESSVTPAKSYRTYIATSRAAYIAGIEAGISPQELRAHTGVIGEAFVADHLGVKLTSTNNQPGYDLIDKDDLRVSVKTITTSTHVTLNESTLDQVDRIIVVWLGTEADELDVVIVYDKSTDDFIADAATYQGKRRLSRSDMAFPYKPISVETFSVGDIVDTHNEGNVLFRRHSSGSFTVLVDGKPEPAFRHLMSLRNSLGLPDKVNNTTRTLGAQVFGKLRSKIT